MLVSSRFGSDGFTFTGNEYAPAVTVTRRFGSTRVKRAQEPTRFSSGPASQTRTGPTPHPTPLLTGALLGRSPPRVPAAKNQQEADRLAQEEVAPAGQAAVPGRVRQVCDRYRREIHEILALRLHHLHHGDDRRRLRVPDQQDQSRTTEQLPAFTFKIKETATSRSAVTRWRPLRPRSELQRIEPKQEMKNTFE